MTPHSCGPVPARRRRPARPGAGQRGGPGHGAGPCRSGAALRGRCACLGLMPAPVSLRVCVAACRPCRLSHAHPVPRASLIQRMFCILFYTGGTAGKMMGDLGTSGDAPFGGEVALDPESQVGRAAGWLAGGRAARWRLARWLPACLLRACCVPTHPGCSLLPACAPTPHPQLPTTHPPTRQVYWWHDKYRPRRPKYFNRVHTGCAGVWAGGAEWGRWPAGWRVLLEGCSGADRVLNHVSYLCFKYAPGLPLLPPQLRVEQVQPDALRRRQPAAQDRHGARLGGWRAAGRLGACALLGAGSAPGGRACTCRSLVRALHRTAPLAAASK